MYGDIAEGVRAIGSLAATDRPDRLVGRVTLVDPDGQPLLVIDEVEMAVLGPAPARPNSPAACSLWNGSQNPRPNRRHTRCRVVDR
ncbi:phthiocerol synthesis polyketide synthase type I PpsC domain protein [Mycobacterium ulcerans str. Harvey]|uniref:Phthiocerol synthesis polyketide synthase type I PpsC domain protein n=1 Tax=Mycobacterium ulcerans str. Harvey TaxID=1299332 RepID=A0ABN0QZZ8_MYCUL|nr:phthiocerol synthesis polyketide synthase type I PpsC domain protein [Mycobacterium ulcerans str. Harvey]